MATPTFSAKLPDVTLKQLNDLSELYGIGKTQVVIRAISDLHKKEVNTMTSTTSHKYYAWANNDRGASLDVTLPMSESSRSMRAYENAARNQLGSGWKVHIMRVDIDGDGQSVIGQPTEVKAFTIR